MRFPRRSSWWFFLFLGAVASATAAPEAPGLSYSKPEVRKEIVAVVENQLAAFAANDFAKAYTFAAGGLRQQFTVQQFEVMVTRGYPLIVRPKRTTFGLPTDDGATAILPVEITAADGRVIAYRYLLVKESGAWRIAGVLENKPRASDA